MAEQIGKQLGNYRLSHLLGQGGFSDVYLGEHVFLKTQAAIKVLRTQLASDDLKDFLHEARIIAHLKHPHIVRVLEFGVEEDDSQIFLVMDYAPNGTLRQQHPKGTRLEMSCIIQYVRQVADALQYAHDQRLIHRDVKPENMLLGQNNEVLLSDFGVATVFQNSLSFDKQEIVGTLGYIAPEQLRGKPRRASDQYALGIVVYEWLTGERPFQGSPSEIIGQHMLTPPPPLHLKAPSIPPSIEEVVLQALEKDPSKRFSSVQAFATALEQACVTTEPFVFNSTATTSPPGPEPTLPKQRVVPAHTESSVDESTLVALPPPQRRALSDQTFATIPFPREQATFRTQAIDYVHSTQPPVLSPQAGKCLMVYRGHTDWVRAVAWLPKEGGLIASAGNDKTIHVWNAKTGSKISVYRGHTGAVYAVMWSPNGKCLASASADKTAQVWDVATGQRILSYQNHADEVYAVAWSPDGAQLASVSADRTLQIWHAATGGRVIVCNGHTDWVRAVAWSPDGAYIASASNDKTIRVWNAATGDNVKTFRGHRDWVRAIAWSPNGKYLTSASNDKTVQVWNAKTGSSIFTYYGHSNSWIGGVLTVMWAPDGSFIASAGEDQIVQLWSLFSEEPFFTYPDHSAPIDALTWSPDGNYIASAGYDKTIRVWQIL